jgi:polyisoprenyl-phosphate glycosyltransferase
MLAEDKPTLSVIIPMYNEEAVLPLLVERLRPILDGLGVTYEVMAVNDGSSDDTASILRLLRRTWPQLRLIEFRRNCGHQAALTAGLHRAKGHYVVSIDADLQDPPEVIGEMLRLAQSQDLAIVYGVRSDRSTDTVFKRNTAGLYYRLMRRIVGKKVPAGAGDFRLLRSDAVEALKSLPEQKPVYRLLVPWLGFASGEVAYVRARRAAGSTKYPLGKMIKLAVDSVVSFTAAPLRLAIWLGLAGGVTCIALTVFTFVSYLRGDVVPGWTSLFLAVMFLGTIQLVCLGLLGEYVGRIFQAVQHRPTYFVGYDSDDPAEDAEPVVEQRRSEEVLVKA